jgi:hypothetical protein
MRLPWLRRLGVMLAVSSGTLLAAVWCAVLDEFINGSEI